MISPRKSKAVAAERKLRIAVVYSRSPLPMRHADQLTVAHLIEFLTARGHDVELFAVDAGGKRTAEEDAWLNARCRSVNFYRHDLWSIASGLAGVFTRRLPMQVGLFTNSKQRGDIASACENGRFDVVYTYYVRSAEVTKSLAKLGAPRKHATFLAMQLSQALNTRRISENSPNVFNRLLYSIESRLMARYEARIWAAFDRSVLIGPADVAEIEGLCRRFSLPSIANYVYGAHGTDLDRFRPKDDVKPRPCHLVFSGVMKTPTNVQAAQWFAREVWPLIIAEMPVATWSIVGREPSAEVLALRSLPGVEVTGTVPDTARLIGEATVCINPMQAGGGMQNKLIEYLACGKPVVCTSLANEGIKAVDGRDLIIQDDPKAFAKAVIGLLSDPERRSELGSAGREFVENGWTWESHFLRLEGDFYQAVDELRSRDMQ